MTRTRGTEQLVLRHRNHVTAEVRALSRAVERGTMRRLRSGACVPTAVWERLSKLDRKRLEIAAAAEMNRDFVASHRSAAALWGVPTIRNHDDLVHARATVAAGTRTEHGVRKHAVKDLDLHRTTVLEIPCTTLERTVLDLAATEDFDEAVVAMDWALRRGITKERLRTVLDEWAPTRDHRRVESVIDFADPRSGSAGESWSRYQIAEAGLIPPELQHPFFDAAGRVGFVDFWWPAANRIGEFDGLMKYKEAEYRDGRTAGEVVSDEKIREDRLRATKTVPGVSRWTWATLTERGALADLLHRAGVPRLR